MCKSAIGNFILGYSRPFVEKCPLRKGKIALYSVVSNTYRMTRGGTMGSRTLFQSS